MLSRVIGSGGWALGHFGGEENGQEVLLAGLLSSFPLFYFPITENIKEEKEKKGRVRDRIWPWG